MKYHELTEKLIGLEPKDMDSEIRTWLEEKAKKLKWKSMSQYFGDAIPGILGLADSPKPIIDQMEFVQACQSLKEAVAKLSEIVDKLPKKNFGEYFKETQ